MRTSSIFLSMAFYVASSHSALPDDTDTTRMHAAYLSEPTDWCAANVGVPVIITVDGPDLLSGEIEDQPKEVRVRRGGSASQSVDVGRVDPSQVRVGSGTTRRLFDRIYPRIDELEPAGRLRADIRVCDTYWSDASISANWSIEASDGSTAHSGDKDMRFLSNGHPLFSTSGRYPKTIRLGDLKFVVMREPEIKRTTEAFVSPAMEQPQ